MLSVVTNEFIVRPETESKSKLVISVDYKERRELFDQIVSIDSLGFLLSDYEPDFLRGIADNIEGLNKIKNLGSSDRE